MVDRRFRDAALLLPMAGALLFLPPYIRVFDQHVTVLGVPLLHIYLFGVWFAGILVTALLSRRLARSIGNGSADRGREAFPGEPPDDGG